MARRTSTGFIDLEIDLKSKYYSHLNHKILLNNFKLKLGSALALKLVPI